MEYELLVRSVIFGFSTSAILFLVSIGISIGFGLMGVVNLEQMLYYTIGAYIMATVLTITDNFWLGLCGGIGVAATVGLIVERFLLRKTFGHDLLFKMVTTFSTFLMGVGLIQFIWGLNPMSIAPPTEKTLLILGQEIPIYRIIVILIAVAVYIFMQVLLNKTIIGRALSAAMDNRDNVEGLGINISKIVAFTFVIASGLAGLGGALNGPLLMVGPYMGFDMLLFAFVTVVLGGLGSIKGTLVSALILGQVISVGGVLWTPLSYLAPFLVMFFVLLIKPTGLFGIADKAFGFEE